MGRARRKASSPDGAVNAMRPLLALCVAGSLTACQTFSPDAGMSVVTGIAKSTVDKDVAALRSPEDAVAARAKIGVLLRRPLTADAAVQIAFLNNRGLQAAYNALGLAEADMVRETLPPNPTFSLERVSGPLEIEIERRVIGNILTLATLPTRSAIAADRFRQAQLRAAEETLRLAAATRRAYFRALAARQLVRLLERAKTAAETASQLATRLGRTGALNKLDQAREHVFYADVTGELAKARLQADRERERLVRLMGLWGEDLDFKLPAALPPLPRRAQTLPNIEQEAVRRRLDLRIARLELEALAKTYGLAEATRFVNLLEASAIDKTVKDKERDARTSHGGFELEFQIPLFDFGAVRARQAEQTYLQAVNRLLERAVNARSEARQAYRAYRASYDIAMHYRNQVLPLRDIISEEMLLRYNAMQVDVFALLAEARQRVNANVAALAAQRDFWLASVDLGVAVMGGGDIGEGEGAPVSLAAGADPGPAH